MTRVSDQHGTSGGNHFFGDAENVVQANNIGNVNIGGQRGVNQRFAGHWRETMQVATRESVLWILHLDGTFSAQIERQDGWQSLKARMIVKAWHGRWRVATDGEGPWIELIATDCDSPTLGLISAVFNQPEQKRGALANLTRSAHITDQSAQHFELSWIDRGGRPTTSLWARL